MGLNLMGWSIAAFLLVFLSLTTHQPIQWLVEHLPVVKSWSTTLLSVMLIDGVLIGFLLSVNETIQPLDDELVFQSVKAVGARHSSIPIGLILVVLNLFSFYLACGVYLLVSIVQESMSKSVVKAMVATFVLVGLASIIYQPGRLEVLIWGGNVAFPALLFGWAIGDMFRPGLY